MSVDNREQTNVKFREFQTRVWGSPRCRPPIGGYLGKQTILASAVVSWDGGEDTVTVKLIDGERHYLRTSKAEFEKWMRS